MRPITSRLYPLALAALILAPAPAGAAEPERLAYSIMLGGLHVGDAMVSLDETSAGYKAGMKMTAVGALKWVKDFRSSMDSQGALAPKAQPASYRREWAAGDVAEAMTMTFDSSGAATVSDKVYNPKTGEALTHEDIPWNRHSRAKPVPADMRTNVFDPMGAFVAARAQFVALGVLEPKNAGKPFKFPVFDGTRRYDIVGKTEAPRSVTINGVEKTLMPVTGHMEPVFGFTKEGEERMRAIDGKVYFSTDGRYVPEQIIVAGELFNAVMNLTGDCKVDNAPCAAVAAAFEPQGEQRAQAP